MEFLVKGINVILFTDVLFPVAKIIQWFCYRVLGMMMCLGAPFAL